MQLRSRGEPVKLEKRPLDLLVMLVRSHGRMVAREDIVSGLWPAKVIIDFDSGLNTLVRKVRGALGDSPDKPQFVETVPGRGYRFVADQLIVLDKLNPQTAAKLVPPLGRWKRFDEARAAKMRAELERILATPGLSKDMTEQVGKSLEG